MSKKTFMAVGFIFFLALAAHSNTPVVYAAKARVRSTTTSVRRVSGTSFSTAKLSRATNSVVVTFINLDKAVKVNYILAYTANGIEQGAGGDITPTGTTDSRDLYFGTCSKGVCTPHRNITGATLTITTTLKSGGTNTKLYRIKI